MTSDAHTQGAVAGTHAQDKKPGSALLGTIESNSKSTERPPPLNEANRKTSGGSTNSRSKASSPEDVESPRSADNSYFNGNHETTTAAEGPNGSAPQVSNHTIDAANKKTAAVPPKKPEGFIDNGPPPAAAGSRRTSRRHRRGNSDDVPRVVHGTPQEPQLSSSSPPVQQGPPPPFSSSRMQQQQPPPLFMYGYPHQATPPGYYGPQYYQAQMSMVGAPPPNLGNFMMGDPRTAAWAATLGKSNSMEQTTGVPPSHIRRYSGGNVPFPPPPSGPEAFYYGPEIYASQLPPQPAQRDGRPMLSTQHSERNVRAARRQRRKAHSSSAAMPNDYGAFWNGPSGAPPPPPSSQPPLRLHHQQSPRTQSDRVGSFSPRSDVAKFASGFRDPSPPPSPRGMSALSPTMATAYRKKSPVQDIRVTWSPRTPIVEEGSLYAGHHPPSPFLAGGSDHGSPGGEGVYFAQKRVKNESARKRHMRQQSAQEFMEDFKGVEQPPACRDLFFLLLFVFHLLFMVYLNNLYGYEAFKPHDPVGDDTSSVTIYYQNLVYITSLCGGFAMVVSAVLLFFMTLFARRFVQVALIVVITLSFVWGTIGIGLSPKNVVPITGIIALALSVAYTFIVWDRIPFAASNLVAALSGIRAHSGTVVVAFVFQAISLAWTIFYTIVVIGVYDSIKMGLIPLSDRMTTFVYVMLGVSYYWTYQVLLNIVQVATAGVIGGWWYMHETEQEPVIKRSAFKTMFYSMGSICYGSLFVGPVRIIRQLSVLFRPSSDEASLLCLHECLHCVQTCICSFVDALSDRYTPWAFTFIGLYGYGFIEAGQHATYLFERRGWTTIVSDDLVPNILLMTSLVIGGVTGCFGHLLSEGDRLRVLSLDEPGTVAFSAGVVVGLALTSVLFGVISSSVKTVMVCFATSPADFEENHPDLSREMRDGWREVWPGALDVIDLRMSTGSEDLDSDECPANPIVPLL